MGKRYWIGSDIRLALKRSVQKQYASDETLILEQILSWSWLVKDIKGGGGGVKVGRNWTTALKGTSWLDVPRDT